MAKIFVTKDHAEKFMHGWLNKYETHRRLMLDREATVDELRETYLLTHEVISIYQVQQGIAEHGST